MEYNIKVFREELRDCAKWKNAKASFKTFQKEAQRLLNLSDAEIEEWIKKHNSPSFLVYTCREATKKSDKAKYNRLKNKAQEDDFDGFTEEQEEFIELYEEENNIKGSLFDLL